MTKYVLRPQLILPQIVLEKALHWIAFKYYPDEFYDKDNKDFTYLDYTASDLDTTGMDDDTFNYDIDGLNHFLMFKTDLLNEFENPSMEYENAKHKLFSLFSENKIQLYGAKRVSDDEFFGYEYESLSPKGVQYNDFDWCTMSLNIGNTTYRYLLVSTDDLFDVYPLSFSKSQKVQFAANNYFMDTSDNDEVQIDKTRGRKPKLAPNEIAMVVSYFQKILLETPNKNDTFYIQSCISWAEKHFKNISIPRETMRGWLINILPGRNNEN